MDENLDLSRWRERPRGVGYRRWVILSTGLRKLSRLWFFRVLFLMSWVVATFLALTGFLASQSVVEGGELDSLLSNFGPRGAAVASAIRAVVLLYPDVVMNTLFTTIFWLETNCALFISLLALTAMIPSLVTRDRASNALTVYLSRPLTSADYLLGKLGTIAGVLILLWTGPLLFTWLLSVLFASDHDFLVYSLSPLLRALLFNGIALVALSAIAMGVSALTRTARTTIVVWLGLWLVAGFVADIPHMPRWMQHVSFNYDLSQLRSQILGIGSALTEAGQKLPLINHRLSENLTEAGRRTTVTDAAGSLAGLIMLGALGALSLFRRFKPE
jgi:ABC-type transport system involved in multi-copper enzyme maturation permease subunit